MSPRRRWVKGIAVLVAVLATMTGLALAFWGTSSTPGGGGAAAATSINQGATPTAVVSNGTKVTVTWSATTMTSGAAVTGYVVKRYDSATSTQQTILTACTGVITATTCSENSVPGGSWRYTVTPVVGTNWVGAESAKSTAVSVDTTAPTNSLALSVTSGAAVIVGNTVYYRGAAAGSFKIVNAVADSGSGPASSTTAALSGITTGWSHTPSSVSTPAGGPYTSNAFTWTLGTSSSPSVVVTGSDVSGNTTTTTLTFANDLSGPSGGSIGATGLVGAGAAYSTSTTLNLTLAKGSDPSGLAASGAQLTRATATLISSDGVSDGSCGTFGSYTLVATDPGATKTDTVTDQACYSYRYVVSDALGNTTTYTGSPIKVDTTAPSTPNLVFTTGNNTYWPSAGSTVYYRPAAATGGFSVTVAGTDPASGISAYTFPNLGTNWSSTPSGPGATYSWSGSPAAPGTKTITVTNNAGLVSSTASFTMTVDSTAPTTGTVSYPNGTQTSTSVAVSFTTGIDAGSGVGTRLLQRASATLTGSTCGSLLTFSTIATNPTSPYTDTVSKNNCYQYQYVTSDNVGNQGTPATSSNVVTVVNRYYDVVMATTGVINYWRLGDTNPVGDSFTDATGVLLQSHTGETGATWTRASFTGTSATITAADRIRKSGSGTTSSVYYASGMPPSADYTVQADLTMLSSVGNDRTGVIGRANTSSGSGTYYRAVYDNPSSSWQLSSVVNGTVTSLGTSQQYLTWGTAYRLSLDMQGSAIRLLVNGVQLISTTNNAITSAGSAGVAFGNGSSSTDTDSTGMHLDNFAVTSPTMTDAKGTLAGTYVGGVSLGQTGGIARDTDTAVTFDGSSDYASVNKVMTGDFSVEFWFKSSQGIGTGGSWWEGAGLVDASNNNGYLRDWGIDLRSDGRIVAGLSDDSTNYNLVSTTGGYNNNVWHQVVFTRTQSTGLMTLYVDGVSVGTATGSQVYLTSPVINFGRVATGANYYSGSLDDVSFYSGALSATTVASHYIAGS